MNISKNIWVLQNTMDILISCLKNFQDIGLDVVIKHEVRICSRRIFEDGFRIRIFQKLNTNLYPKL